MRYRQLSRSGTRAVTALALSYLPALASYHLLSAEGPLFAVLIYCTLVECLFFVRFSRRRPSIIDILLAVLLIVGALIVLIALAVTPASAFLAWFALLRHGEAKGTIGFVFTVGFAYFSSLFAGIFIASTRWRALIAYLFANAFLIAVVLQSAVAEIPVFLLAAVFLVCHVYQRTDRRQRGEAISSLQLIITAAALAAAMTPLMVRNPIVDSIMAAPVEAPLARLFPRFPFLYSVPGYGYSFNNSDRGGRPVLTSRPVFKVTAGRGETIYLRTAAYDTYTENGWVFGEQAKQSALDEAELNAGVKEQRLQIEVLIDFVTSLPNTLDTVRIDAEGKAFPPLAYADAATGYVLSVPITAGFRLSETRREPRPNGRLSTSNAEKPSTPPPTRFLQTSNLPHELRSLAAGLRRTTPVETLAAIRTYLVSHDTYSLDAPRIPKGMDPVTGFLFTTRSGYCVQFASAFTVLARLVGIPARYVTGFLVNLPDDSNTVTVTGLSAHAWSEVWIAGEGWVTEEATPPMIPTAFRDPDYYHRFNPTDSGYADRRLRALMGARVAPPPAAPVSRRPIPVVPAAIGFATLGFFLALLRAIVSLLLPRPVKLRRIVRKTLRRSRSLGLASPNLGGWRRWGDELGAATSRPRTARRAAGLILELAFGGRTPTKRDLRFFKGLFRRLRRLSIRPRKARPDSLQQSRV